MAIRGWLNAIVLAVAVTFVSACGDGSTTATTDGDLDLGDGDTTDTGFEDCIVKKVGFRTLDSVSNSGWEPENTNDCYKVELDANGRVVTFFPDTACNGTYSSCFRYAYENDRLTARYYDESCNDGLGNDEKTCTINTYDAKGLLVRVASYYHCSDESVLCWDYTYDAKGRETSSTYSDCKGTKLGCYTKDYDDAHNRITRTSDSHLCDGTQRTCCSYTYDAHGYRISGGCDEGCDSVMDTDCQEGLVNEQGWIVRESHDDDCQPPEESCTNITYDANGHMRLQSSGCGVAQSWCYWQLYNDAGHLEKLVEDYSCDQRKVVTQEYTYDETGRLASCHISSTTNATTIDYSYTYGRCRSGALRAIDSSYEIAARNPCTWAGSW